MKHRADSGGNNGNSGGGADGKKKADEHPDQHQPDEKASRSDRKQAGQGDPHHKQADRRATDDEEQGGPQARTADSSPGDPPAGRSDSGTAPPDGPTDRPHASTRYERDERAAIEIAAAAEPGRGQLPATPADPRIDIGTADSKPSPDGTTGSDRDTMKPGA